jgi:hypothetical protein
MPAFHGNLPIGRTSLRLAFRKWKKLKLQRKQQLIESRPRNPLKSKHLATVTSDNLVTGTPKQDDTGGRSLRFSGVEAQEADGKKERSKGKGKNKDLEME